MLIDTGPARAPQTTTAVTHSGGRLASSHRLGCCLRCHDVSRCCCLTQSTANPAEEARPEGAVVRRRRLKLPQANWSPNLQASDSQVLAANSPSSAARRTQGPSSATVTARRPPQHSISAASRRRPRRLEQRQTADFRQSGISFLRPEAREGASRRERAREGFRRREKALEGARRL